jgi:chromosome segregation ATPase
MHLIAKEEVEVEHLAQRIADAEEQLCDNRQNIMRLKADLATGEVVFQYAGRTYSVDRVKTDLANRFERYKTNEATLESLRQIHQARQASLDAAREKLEGMLAKKRQYQVEVENLEARLQMVAAAKASCDYQFDDSRLGRTKELIAELRKRLDIEATLANAEGYFHDEIPLDETAPDNIVDQITDYFSESLADESSLAVKD